MPNDLKVLTVFPKISFLSFIFWYIFRIVTSNKVFYFSKVNVFIACYFSKIYLPSERKAWFYFTKNFQFFGSKTFEFLFINKEMFLENSSSWSFYLSQVTVFTACHLSKIDLQTEGKAWLYLAKSFQCNVSKTFQFFSEKRIIPWKQLFLNFKNIITDNFQLY